MKMKTCPFTEREIKKPNYNIIKKKTDLLLALTFHYFHFYQSNYLLSEPRHLKMVIFKSFYRTTKLQIIHLASKKCIGLVPSSSTKIILTTPNTEDLWEFRLMESDWNNQSICIKQNFNWFTTWNGRGTLANDWMNTTVDSWQRLYLLTWSKE